MKIWIDLHFTCLNTRVVGVQIKRILMIQRAVFTRITQEISEDLPTFSNTLQKIVKH